MFGLLDSEWLQRHKWEETAHLRDVQVDYDTMRMNTLISEYNRIKQMKNKDYLTTKVEKYYEIIFEDPEIFDDEISMTFILYYLRELYNGRSVVDDNTTLFYIALDSNKLLIQAGRNNRKVKEILLSIFHVNYT